MSQPRSKPGTAIVDSSSRVDEYIVQTANGRFVKLTRSAYQLLERRKAGATFEELGASLRSGAGEPLGAEAAEVAYRKLAERIERIANQDSLTLSGFWFRREFLPGRWVGRLASWFTWMFSPFWAVVMLLGVATAAISAARSGLHVHHDSASLALGFALFLTSVMFHELGHATACARFGVEPGPIGVGVYLIYPVFYSDVTGAWGLRRWQRVVVDLGGLYFQFVIGSLFLVVSATLGWRAFETAALMIGGSTIFSLNPIFKFDGYWVLSDAFGVTNLSRQPRAIVAHLWKRLRGVAVAPLPWPSWVSAFLLFYTVATFAMWGWFLLYLVPLIRARVVPFPRQVLAFAGRLLSDPRTVGLDAWGEFLFSLYLFSIAVFVLVRLTIPIGRSLKRRLFHGTPDTENRPHAH